MLNYVLKLLTTLAGSCPERLRQPFSATLQNFKTPIFQSRKAQRLWLQTSGGYQIGKVWIKAKYCVIHNLMFTHYLYYVLKRLKIWNVSANCGTRDSQIHNKKYLD